MDCIPFSYSDGPEQCSTVLTTCIADTPSIGIVYIYIGKSNILQAQWASLDTTTLELPETSGSIYI